MKTECDVIVVGAGAAGLMAARELQRGGREVVVLEAAARAGGRLLTVHPLGPDLPIELGAEFLHGDAPVTRGLLDELRLRYVEGEGVSVSARGGAIEPAEDRFAQVGRLLSLIDTAEPDRPFAEWLAAEPGGRELTPARLLARRFVEGFHAADATRISTHALAEGGDMESIERSARVVAGHQAIAEAMAAELGDAVWLGTRAVRVRWQPGRCTVEATAADGESQAIQGRGVVIGVSVGVLQHGGLVIDPLPDPVAAALRQIAMGDVVRLPFIFATRFWEDERLARAAGGPLGFIHTPDSPFNVWWTQHPLSAPVLVAWAGGTAARQLLRMAPGDRTQLALADLARALGLAPATLEREVLHAGLHDWCADPFTRGAYSYPLAGGADAWRALTEVHAGTLAFAGEALAADQGTVEVALASGRRAAQALLRREG